MKSALVIISVLAVFAFYASAEDICYQPLEICVTMDESGSISSSEFNTMKTFAGNVASKFNLGTVLTIAAIRSPALTPVLVMSST